jgi:crossover junction endodeoxyribonuclease RuvC
VRVLGIDPGTYKMGVGVVSADGPDLELAYSGVISPGRRDALPKRLEHLFDALTRVVREWEPSEVAIEAPFAGRNVKAAMAIGHAQAMAMLVASQSGLAIASYAPREVKQAVTNHGGSSKEQVQEMVSVLLGLDEPPKSADAADALAVAICHINAAEAARLEMRE